MPATFDAKHVFAVPWSDVTSAVLRKYHPAQPLAPHVLAVDTFRRELRGDRLHLWKLIRCAAPVHPMVPFPDLFVVEHTVIDRTRQNLLLTSRNLTATALVRVDERCLYSSLGLRTTLYRHTALVSASVPFFGSALETAVRDSIAEKSGVGIRAVSERLREK